MEYRTFVLDFPGPKSPSSAETNVEDLNALADEGWEVISVLQRDLQNSKGSHTAILLLERDPNQ